MLLAIPSCDLFPCAHWVRKSKIGTHVLLPLSLPTQTSVFFFLFPFATKRSNLHTRAEKGSCRPQWVLQAQLFPLRLGSPGTNQLALRDIRSRSFIGQVRTYNLFYTQGHRGCGLGLAMLRDRNWWCWESRMFNSHQRGES